MLDIAIPSFGYKAHTSIDRRYRLIRLLGRHRRQPARRLAVAPGPARPHEHRRRRLGRHRLSLAAERDVPGAARIHQPYPPPPPAWPTPPGTHPPRQCQALAGPGSGRTRVRGTEASHGADRPHDRSRPGAHEDRDGQPCLQPPAPRSTSEQCHRLTRQPRDPYARISSKRAMQPPKHPDRCPNHCKQDAKRSIPAGRTSQCIVDRGSQLLTAREAGTVALSDQVLTSTAYVQPFMPLSTYIQTSCLPSPQYVEFTIASTGSILSSGSLEFQMDTNNPRLSP